ncbi:AEC family transporter [Hansschlegelia beijingensis]|uniref:AEC family transporter n=1 Tax=Hansschlegelia beijingensis TaxID=1133344 RepID=UPI003807A111
MTLDVIVLALAPVFFVLGLGYVAGRRGMVENHHVESLNTLVMNFAVPASLFVATASASRSQMLAQAPLFAILGGVMLLVYIGWYLLARFLLKASRAEGSLQALTIAFPNLAGVGLPISASVLGATGTVPVAVALAAGSILVTPLALVTLEMASGKGDEAGASAASRIVRAFRRAITKPVVLAPALGIAVSLSELTLDPVLKSCLMLIGNAAAGVALFLTGLVLSAQTFRFDWKVAGATGAADIARPLIAAGIVLLLPLSSDTAKIAILLAAIPSGFFGILFAVNYRLDSATTGSMVAASTAFSVIPMAIAIALLFPH